MLSSFVFFTGVPAALAQTPTPVTVRQAIRVPGGVLTPGQYEFRSIPGNDSAIEIRGTAQPTGLFVRVIPTSRLNRGGILAVHPTVPGAIAELASWYPDGGLAGYEFVARATSPVTLSAQNLATIEGQLADADKAVTDAQHALTAAESNRDGIRAERARARQVGVGR